MSIFVEHIDAKGFLSFGPDWPGLDLRDLNILIGPNASGKSNLIEALAFFKSLPDDPGKFLAMGGQGSDWLWKGSPSADMARLTIRSGAPQSELWAKVHGVPPALTHQVLLARSSTSGALQIIEENVQGPAGTLVSRDSMISLGDLLKEIEEGRYRSSVYSALARPKGEHADELFGLADRYRSVQIFRGPILLGPESIKQPQSPSLPIDYLSEYGRNLGGVLNSFRVRSDSRQRMMEAIQEVNPSIVDFGIQVANNTSLLYVDEGLAEQIPLSRMSDGTIRFLCLLAILLKDPLPPLICIEEPELGLHPDMMVVLGRLLRQAAERTQLIVTTHSPALVDAFTDEPESVVVCERTPAGSSMKRLSSDDLKGWLDEYHRGLGQVWTSGQIGGNRW